jgi:hypothetical protein
MTPLGAGSASTGIAGIGLSGVTTRAKPKAKEVKVDVCPYDADADAYVSINVSQNGWDNGHSKHEKDFQRGDCCNDSECSYLDELTCYIGVRDQSTSTCSKVFTGDGGCLT